MKLTREQFIKYVNTFEKMYKEDEQIWNVLDCDEWKPSRWVDQYYNFLSDMCELPEPVLEETLDWFCFQIDFGKREDRNFITWELPSGTYSLKIRTAADLWKYIEVMEDC